MKTMKLECVKFKQTTTTDRITGERKHAYTVTIPDCDAVKAFENDLDILVGNTDAAILAEFDKETKED